MNRGRQGSCPYSMDLVFGRIATVVFMLACAAVVAGCGSGRETYPASGRVEFADGTPLIEGFVSFHSMDAEKPATARGQIQPDGSFVLGTNGPSDGAVLGKHEALIVPVHRGSRAMPGDELRPKPRKFDAKFSSYQTSGLQFTVTEDESANSFKIVIK